MGTFVLPFLCRLSPVSMSRFLPIVAMRQDKSCGYAREDGLCSMVIEIKDLKAVSTVNFCSESVSSHRYPSSFMQ